MDKENTRSGRFGEKGGDNRTFRYIQALVSASTHKALVLLALDRNCSLATLLGDIVTNFINEESENGRKHTRSTTSST